MAAVAFYLFATIAQQVYSGGRSRWNGSPEFTRLTFELFGALFALGLTIFAAGLYQVRKGRRNPALVAATLLVAAVVVFLGFGIVTFH